jgi:acyl-CoA reductase-like NAD-dependent aldehyde dehydrogenase
MVAGSSPRISPDHGGDEAGAGAKPVAGGGRAADLGYFIQPTVLNQADPSVKILDEEIFGPALSVLAFAKEALEDIAALANRTRYGRRPASEPSMTERRIGWARLSGQFWVQGGRRLVGAMS